MDTLDPAGEFLRITERYRRMSDNELLVLMPQSSELTPFAQQALANEVRSRGLKAEVEDEKPVAPSPFKPPPAFFEHESPELGVSAGHDFPEPDSSDDPDSYQEDPSHDGKRCERSHVEIVQLVQVDGFRGRAGLQADVKTRNQEG